MVELLRTHPKLLVGGLSLDNPHYLGPDAYVASRRVRAWAALSESERRVAELAADGLSTTDVAAAIHPLSRRDVDRSLHRIFRKLGLATREDLVRFVTERRHAR